MIGATDGHRELDRAAGSAGLPTRSPESWGFVLPVAAAYLLVVLVTLAHHEYWRDEVRALSIATATPSWGALFAELRFEGHPVLWYLLLRTAHGVASTPLVLPFVSIAVGAGAVLLFLRQAPYGRAMKVLFTFGLVPVYEYTVMARNYGISMLALFGWALAWRTRRTRPWLVGLMLALLANTNVHSALIAGTILLGWLLDQWQASRAREGARLGPFAVGLAIAGAGLALAALTIRPAPDLLVVSTETRSLVRDVVSNLHELISPAAYFGELLGILRAPLEEGDIARALPYAGAVVLDLILLALVGGLWLAGGPLRWTAGLALAGLTLLFAAIYPGSLRHEALLLVLVVAVEWARREQAPVAARLAHPRLGRLAVQSGLVVLLTVHVLTAGKTVLEDVRGERSTIRRMAAWLRTQPDLAAAPVVGEPAFYVEALPYYAGNPLYFARERKWGLWARWSRAADTTLTLGTLLATAQRVERETRRPVVIALGYPRFSTERQGDQRPGIRDRFTWTTDEWQAWQRATVLRATFTGATHENVLVYALRPAGAGPVP
jgi:hypothetical protein